VTTPTKAPADAAPPAGAARRETADAVVIGGGPNGLVAAITLADAGWDVVLLEARDKVGGAVSSVERDGWVMDEFSACYPLAVASPVMSRLGLEDHGLEWCRSDVVVSHAGRPDDTVGATIFADVNETAAALAEDRREDGPAWLEMVEQWYQLKAPFLDALLTRWPPVEAGSRLARSVGAADTPALARFFLLPATRMAEERFAGQRARTLLLGNAMHADIPPEAPGSGLFGWLMSMLAQDVGYPSPRGGAGQLAAALAARARAAGVEIHTGDRVDAIDLVDGRAALVRTARGVTVRARRAVVADTSAPMLYEELLSEHAVSPRLRHGLREFAWDLPTVKINYRLRSTPPWTAANARKAAVVHVGADVDGIVHWAADLATHTVPSNPFALVGQMTTADPSRSPAGTEALWLYSHLPRGVTDDASADLLVKRAEEMLDRYAPGWGDLVLDRWVQRPSDLAAADANLVNGAVNGGTAQLFQQLIFRPVTGLGGPRTPVDGLYLGSAAIHPGGGVHGGCGFLAARQALLDHRWWRRPGTAAAKRLLRRLEL
jgi:phytoene dehydrogenase-like protein